jgi:hypothetical protein
MTRSRRAASLSIAILTSLIFVLTLPAWIPHMPSAGADPSWVAVLEYAYDQGWHWGSDVAFTFGPLGFLYSRYYDPMNYNTLLIAWTFLAGSAGLGLCAIVGSAGLLATIVASVGLAISFVAFTPDVFLFSAPLLLVVVWCSPTTTVRTAALPCLVVSCCLITQIKLSALPLCLLSIILIDLGELFRRRIPLFSATFVIVTLAIWKGAGQSISDIPEFLVNALSAISGYDSTMQQFGSSLELCAYLLTAVLTVSIFGIGLARSHDAPLYKRAAVALCFLAFVLLSFRAGFVRHDLHSLIAWLSLCAGASILLLQSWAMRSRPALRYLAYAIPLVSFAAAASMRALTSGVSPLSFIPPTLSPAMLFAEANAAIHVIGGASRSSLDDQLSQQLSRIAADSRLPMVDGSVDVIPSHQMELIAAKSDYRPRPVYQGYAAYTPRLAELNRRFFASNQAPQFTIFGFDLIDDRYPSTIDGAIWPELLTRYEPVDVKDKFVLLRRRVTAAEMPLTPSVNRTLKFGEELPLRIPATAKAVWAKIKIRETLAGRFVRAVWKAPVVEMVVGDAFKKRRRFRLVPGNAEAGFLLSPMVEDSEQFLDLYVPDTPPSGREVSSIAVEIPKWASLLYAPDIDVSLTELDLPKTRDGPFSKQ